MTQHRRSPEDRRISREYARVCVQGCVLRLRVLLCLMNCVSVYVCSCLRTYMHSHERVGSHHRLAHPPTPLPCTCTFMSADVPCGQRLNTSHSAAPRVREHVDTPWAEPSIFSGSRSASGVHLLCANRDLCEPAARVAQLLTAPSPACDF